jgi:hypothetical protein
VEHGWFDIELRDEYFLVIRWLSELEEEEWMFNLGMQQCGMGCLG